MCRSNFGSQHGDYELDIISLSAVREPLPTHPGSAPPTQPWWMRVWTLIAGVWSALCSKLSGEGALRLPE